MSSDLTLGDRIFSSYGSEIQIEKGTVGQTAETLKQFENIREFLRLLHLQV